MADYVTRAQLTTAIEDLCRAPTDAATNLQTTYGLTVMISPGPNGNGEFDIEISGNLLVQNGMNAHTETETTVNPEVVVTNANTSPITTTTTQVTDAHTVTSTADQHSEVISTKHANSRVEAAEAGGNSSTEERTYADA